MPKYNCSANEERLQETDHLVATGFTENTINNDERIVLSSDSLIQDEENDVLIRQSEPLDRFFNISTYHVGVLKHVF